MQRYIMQRLGLALISLFGLSVFVFVLLRAIPGDAGVIIAGENVSDPAVIERIREDLGLDQPLPVQYITWATDIVTGNLGASLFTKQSVTTLLQRSLPISFELGIGALVIAVLIALPVGIASALYQDTWFDQGLRFGSILALAVPNFWLSTMVIVFGAKWFRWIPPLGYTPLFDEPVRNLQQFFLPAIILGTALAASLIRMLRSSMLEVMREDYIRTARAKGLRTYTVVRTHMLKNALIPVTSLFGVQAGVVIGGTVIIESIFNLPGMGRLIIDAINQRDYPVVQGVVLTFGTVIVLINLVTDLSYAWLDPRIRY